MNKFSKNKIITNLIKNFDRISVREHSALRILKKNDYLWTTPISFVASSNCGLYCGAKIDFVDIDKDTFNISIRELENKLKIIIINNISLLK